MKWRKFLVLPAIAGGLLGISLARSARATIIVDLVNGGASTVQVGQTIDLEYLVSTDNSNGIFSVQTRSVESLTSGGAAQATPFSASVINSTVSTGTHADLVTVASPFATDGNVSNNAPTANFLASGVPNSTSGNEPLWGFIAQSTNGSETGDFFSADNATQTRYIDVFYKALVPGTVFFGQTTTGNGETGNEYNSDGSNSAATVTAEGGFSVTITAVPEPASLSMIGLGALGLLARWRRTAR